MKLFKAGDTSIIVYHLEDGFHATQSHCTHIFAPLGRGEIVGNSPNPTAATAR
jgi:3-phenylpropionate/trans-cinnamate dioxygenase ferredoxin subunit